MTEKLVYMEDKQGLTGQGRIVRVRLSKTGKTLYYAGMEFQSLKGSGYKSNYFEVNSGIEYWISSPKKEGNDTLYPGIVEIDENAMEEYWLVIREESENVKKSSYRCNGKYSRKKPHPELNVKGNSKNGGSRTQVK